MRRDEGAPGQLLPLVRLRWQMVRSPVRRAAVVAGLSLLLMLLAVMVVTTVRAIPTLGLPVDLATQALLVYPAALLLFTVVAIVAPFLAGGAIELFPPSQLVAYPISARTRFAASLLLMPLNITWLLQVVLLTFLVAIGGSGTGTTWTLALVTATFVLCATIAGQALAWAGAAVRQKRVGRWTTNAAGIVLVVLAGLNLSQDTLLDIADASPLLPLLGSGLAPPGPRLVLTLALLAVVAVVARRMGVIAVGWTLRLGNESSGHREGALQRRRTPSESPYRALLVVLLASVWRSRPVRRGVLLLIFMPIAVAAVAELEWSEIVALPGLVAAGAALLFGVNGFSLLGGGAAWLESQPLSPRALLGALAATIGTIVGGATVLTTLGVGLFAPGDPNTAEVVALLSGAVASIAWITATSVRLSVRAPHQADLRGNRDAPAPPGTMAGYSFRLAGTVGLLGLTLVATAQLQLPQAAVVLATAVVVAAGVRALLAVRRWRDPQVRARAMLTVAFG
jgi:hypothetical protein